MLKLFSISIVLFFALSASAYDLCTNCQDIALKIPRELIAKGVTRVGNLDLRELENKFSQVRVVFIRDDQGETPIIGSGAALRTTGVFFMDSRTIAFNMNEWMRTPVEVRPVISLHDHLNASGINDENYEASTALQTLNKLSDKDQIQDFANRALGKPLQELKTRPSAPTYSLPGQTSKSKSQSNGNGATAVGGGGDSTGIQVKMYLLDLTMNLKDLSEESRDKLQEAIIPMSIESDNESDERDYIFNSIPFAISISKARWLYVLNPENRRDAILSMMWDIAKALKIPEAQKRE